MPTSRIAEPADVRDAFSTTGDTVIGARVMTPEILEQRARQASGLPPRGAVEVPPEPAAPRTAPLPQAHVARQHAGREIGRLRTQVEAGRRDLTQRFTFGAQGQQISDPATLARKAELVQQIEAAEAEASRLDSMDDHQVQVWARDRGVQ